MDLMGVGKNWNRFFVGNFAADKNGILTFSGAITHSQNISEKPKKLM